MSRGRGFTIAEIDSLLEIIEDVLPIGPNDWDRVTERHITFYPGLGRTRESLRGKFASLYNHKKPTGDPTCPVYVRNAKRTFERIKEAMDMSDGEGGIGEDVEEEEEEDDADPAVAVPDAPPMGEIIQQNEGGAAAAANNGGASVSGSGQVRGSSSVAGTPLVGTRIRTPRQPQGVGIAGNLSEVMQFMLVRAEAENQAEQRRHQERKDLEDRHHREREDAEERYRCQREEAEERRECRMEMQLSSQSEMMQIFMLSMMEGCIKRKRDDSDQDHYSSGRNVGKTSKEE